MKTIYHSNKEEYEEQNKEIIKLGIYNKQPLFWKLVKETDNILTYISDVIDIYDGFDVSKLNLSFTDNEKDVIVKDLNGNYVHLPYYEEISDLFEENEKKYLGYPTEYAISKDVTINTKDMLFDEIAASNNNCENYYDEDDVQDLLLEEDSCFWYISENNEDKFVDLTGYICELVLAESFVIGVRVVLNIKK